METENKLPKEFKEKWVAALRSGEYKQCKGTMRLEDSYCCLGVAALIYRGKISFSPDPEISSYHTLPNAINNGFSNPIAVELINMNDDGKTFPEIADWIEKNL